jgi:hypothetical protein
VGQFTKSGNLLHDNACNAAEAVRQGAVANLTMNAAGQLASNNAEIAWARACINSCRLNNNNVGMECFLSVLKSLGVNS